jgi:lycopene beta-cyclase
MRMLDHPFFADKSILLVDKGPKTKNDRTWCFWEKEPGYFESIIHHCWPELWVRHPLGDKPLQLGGYSYKMIRSADFYRYCFKKISSATQVKVLYGQIQAMDTAAGTLTVDGVVYTAGSYIFSSIMPEPPQLRPNDIYLLQHFKGWLIETPHEVFNPQSADLMNFRVTQQYGCAFMYLLPVTPRKALVEFTLFTANVLTHEQYDEALQLFIAHNLGLTNYKIAEVEKGEIPMTTYRFAPAQGKVIFTGTAGGQTKASTGYTFQGIQRHSKALVQALARGMHPAGAGRQPWRFTMYDNTLLRVLHEGKMPGDVIFHRLFQKNSGAAVLDFLDNRSGLVQELGIMRSMPTLLFGRAFIGL